MPYIECTAIYCVEGQIEKIHLLEIYLFLNSISRIMFRKRQNLFPRLAQVR